MSKELMDNTEKPVYMREVRSFVKREGRLTAGQERVLESSEYLLREEDLGDVLDLDQLFGRTNTERTLEIGFGNGESLATMAEAAPTRDFLGVEVHRPGVGHLLLEVEKLGLTNLRAANEDAVELLKHKIKDGSFDRVQIFFADPWHKKKHHKRRLVQTEFMNLLATKMSKGGILHLATDWENYAEQMMEVLTAHPDFENCHEGFAPRPDFRPKTKFEARGERLGHGVWDLLFKRR
nr:tRNA (guanosine(46)-N7)-methyltransferase TrmB [Wohlfahrtiimonas chitiniclastica]